MRTPLITTLALAAALTATAASAQITFYERENFDGRGLSSRSSVNNLKNFGFNDQVSSVVVSGEPWEVCDDANFRGSCVVLRPGNYPSMRDLRLNNRLSSARPVRREVNYPPQVYVPPPLQGEITIYTRDFFSGTALNAEKNISDLQRYGFADRASSAVVVGDRWEVCDGPGFSGRCAVLRPGRYPDLSAMGLNNRVSSVRRVPPGVRYEDSRYAPPPVPVYDARRRPQERFYEANVTSVRGVFASPQQQCWIEKERIVQDTPNPNIGGALIGGVIGGILGHQIGGGSGRDVATGVGAIAGAAIGANVITQDGRRVTTQNVQRCSAAPAQGRPDYWDVTYVFRGVEHRMQTAAPPGPTVTVNDNGEPRA